MKISMIGAGQQGVSQGLAFAQLSDVEEVRFFDINLDRDEILNKAAEFNVNPSKIRFVDTLQEAQDEADVTGINVPMDQFETIAYEIARASKSDCIIYDNGSGKTKAVKDIRAGLERASKEEIAVPDYVPTHLFVGRAGTGPHLADITMYKGGTAAVVTDGPNVESVDVVRKLFESIGVKNVRTDLTPQAHDESLGFYSHHNTFFQVSLMRAFPNKEIAGHPVDIGSFLGSTRVAETGKDGVSMWGPISLDNQQGILNAGSIVISKLDAIDQALDDPHILRNLLMQGHNFVASVPEERPAESFAGDLYDLQRQETPDLPVPKSAEDILTSDFSAALQPLVASHVAMPAVFAAASVLGAQEYEKNGGQAFASINNSSFYGTMRPLRNDVDATVSLLHKNADSVREAIGKLKQTHGEMLDAINRQDVDTVANYLAEAESVRSVLPRERQANQIRPVFELK